MNRLFVVNKPSGISSNGFLRKIKRKYQIKKAGYSGTLDPFASGCLIVAFNQYTKLFRFLKKSPKGYVATLHLGAISPTLDNEKIEKIIKVNPIKEDSINELFKNLQGEIEYLPPKYSAKKIDGKKAYELAREDKEFELKKIKSTIYNLELIKYEHPFITFKITISEGGYIRSIGAIISERLNTLGSLSALERINEGNFFYNSEKSLNPLEFLKTEENYYKKDKSDILLGKKLEKENFEKKDNGEYHIIFDESFTIVKIEDENVSYLLNKIRLDKC